MPKTRLTDAAVQRLKAKPGERVDYFDMILPGFVLRVAGPTPTTPDGRKVFALFYRFGGKQTRLTFEPRYPALSLAEARQKARVALDRLGAGHDPAEDKRAAQAKARAPHAAAAPPGDTIELVFAEFVRRQLEPKGRAASYIDDCRRTFRLHIQPPLATRTLSSIKRAEIIALIDTIADGRGQVLANRSLALVRGLFNFAIRRALVEVNPATLVDRPGEETPRDRVLSADEISALWAITGDLAHPWSPYLRLLLLTGQRREEVARMRWADIDESDATWTLPADATKPGRAHVVPLPPVAMQILHECPRAGAHVFSTRRRRNGDEAALSGFSKLKAGLDERLAKAAEAAGRAAPEPWRLHDLRRTCATELGRIGIARFTIARVLNHADRSITSVYDKYSYLPEKRHALNAWAQRIAALTSPPTDNVVTLRG
jgi:integrase